MKPSRWISTGLLIALALLMGCNRSPCVQTSDTDAALKALGNTVPAPEYGREFWQKQHDQKNDTWQQADKLCRESILANYPNCLPVTEIVQADKERETRHTGEMISRGYQYDALRRRWFSQQQMEALGCKYHPRFDLGVDQGRFDCPPYVSLPQGEK
jgi:hypothetical protein